MKRWITAAVMAWAAALPVQAVPGFSPLTVAAVMGDAAAVARELSAGADPNARDWMGLTAMTASMRSCRMTVEVLGLLLDAGADVEARSGVGATPLMVAWQSGRPDLAQVLLAAGADRQATNMYGDTAAEYRQYFDGKLPEAEFATLRYTSLGFPPRSQGFATTHCLRVR